MFSVRWRVSINQSYVWAKLAKRDLLAFKTTAYGSGARKRFYRGSNSRKRDVSFNINTSGR